MSYDGYRRVADSPERLPRIVRPTTAVAAVRSLPAPRSPQSVLARDGFLARGRRVPGSPFGVPRAALAAPAPAAPAPDPATDADLACRSRRGTARPLGVAPAQTTTVPTAPAGVDPLRASLFYVQRRGHFGGPCPDLERQFRVLVERIGELAGRRALPRDDFSQRRQPSAGSRASLGVRIAVGAVLARRRQRGRASRTAGRHRKAARHAGTVDARGQPAVGRVLDDAERWARADGQVSVVLVDAHSAVVADDRCHPQVRVSVTAAHAVMAAGDHLHGASRLLRAGGGHVAAPLTLLRSAIEAGAHAVWLLAPPDSATRVRRAAQLAHQDAADHRRALEQAAAASHGAELAERIRDSSHYRARDVLARACADVGAPNARVGVTGVVREAAGHMGEEGRWLLYLWQLTSGLAHGRPWAIAASSNHEILGPFVAQDVVGVWVEPDAQTLASAAVAAGAVVTCARGLWDERRGVAAADWGPGGAGA